PPRLVPAPAPGLIYPTDPPVAVAPSAGRIRLEGAIWNQNGTITLYWSSVPNAVKYQLEGANEDLSKLRVLKESDQSFFTIPSPPAGLNGFVRVIAIDSSGNKIIGRWFLIPRGQPPK